MADFANNWNKQFSIPETARNRAEPSAFQHIRNSDDPLEQKADVYDQLK